MTTERELDAGIEKVASSKLDPTKDTEPSDENIDYTDAY